MQGTKTNSDEYDISWSMYHITVWSSRRCIGQRDDSLFLVDFFILDMPEESETPLILGRLFLATCRALINVEMGDLILRLKKEQVVFNVFEAMKHKKEKIQCYRVDVV